MTDPNALRVFRLRSTFVESGRLALLSHLEVAHALERTVRRAGLPFAISQGFSPHMKIAFGSALPVGVGSTCEIFDLQLTRYVPADEALALLQQASAPDLMVQSCCYVENSAPAASVAFPFSTYEVCFSEPIECLEAPVTVTVVRKRKEKVLQVAEFLAGPLRLATDGMSATFTLEAKPTGSLRPDVLLQNCGVWNRVVTVTRVAQSEELGQLD